MKGLLAIPGRAAVVVPDSILFEGGAGETIRRQLLRECDVDTLLRLPMGIFYAQGRATWSGKNPDGRWRDFGYEDLVARDKCSSWASPT